MGSAVIAQLVERIHGKDEVSGSTPDRGSTEIIRPTATLHGGYFIAIIYL